MPFPNFAGKHAEDAFFSPAHFIAYKRAQGALPVIPDVGGLILTYQPALIRAVAAEPGVVPVADAFGGETFLVPPSRPDGLPVLVCGGFGIGAPIVSVILEEWIAFGVTRSISIGTAGALQPELAIGDITLVDRTVRDEGVSHHYLPSDVEARPDPALSDRLGNELARLGVTPRVGPTWTIDAPYRETVAELRHYQAEGVLTVEMEASAVCAVAQVRGVALATAFTISDSLADLVWNPQFASDEVQAGLLTLYRAAVAVLSARSV
jgi:uridine phosphorylase